MKLKYNFVTNEVADKIVAVAVGDDLEKFGGFIKLNNIGATAFEMLKNDVTEEDIVNELLKKYPEHTVEETKESVADFINKLRESDLLE